MKLSVLDQSPVPAGSTPAQALCNTIELARLADRLGYERYWIAEHHGMATLASPAPEILIARLGAETSGIRLGSGGVLLPHYSPMKVAETFRVLHALYPGRIDLGIGRAPGGRSLEAQALRQTRGTDSPVDDFPERLAELLAFLRQDFPANHPFSRIHLSPEMPGAPPVWLLGSSMWSASAAARFGLPYAFAHFIDPQPTRAALEHYRRQFEPGREFQSPHALVALGVVCAETEDEAERLAATVRLLFRRIRRGEATPVPTPDEALRELGPGPDLLLQQQAGEWPRYLWGTPEKVRNQLTRIASELQLDELMVITVVHDHQARLRSYELLAEAFELAPRASCQEKTG